VTGTRFLKIICRTRAVHDHVNVHVNVYVDVDVDVVVDVIGLFFLVAAVTCRVSPLDPCNPCPIAIFLSHKVLRDAVHSSRR
jgi:hypothetical protein